MRPQAYPRARYTATPRPLWRVAIVGGMRRTAMALGRRRIATIGRIAAYRPAAWPRFARRVAAGRRFGLLRRDRLVRAAVAPRSGYVTASTSAVGGGQTGQASYYALASRTASGGRVGGATCAHRSLPFGTRLLVTNLANAHQMVLTVNDRGPFIGGRIIDVSRTAAGFLGMLGSGTAPVRIQVVGHS